MSTSAVINLSSFLDMITMRVRYFDGVELIPSHKLALKNLLKNNATETYPVNIRTAVAVINRLRRLAGKPETFTVSDLETIGSYALSYNSALDLLDLEDLSGANYRFSFLLKTHYSTAGNAYNGSGEYRILDDMAIQGVLYGGGAGGSGAYVYSTGKNGNNNTITIGANGPGRISSLIVKNISTKETVYTITASGAPSRGSVSLTTVAGGASSVCVAGGAGPSGQNGSTNSVLYTGNGTASGNRAFRITAGNGGGGSGGVSFTADGAAGQTTVSENVTGTNGGTYGHNNRWTGHCNTWASGGAGGAVSGTSQSYATAGTVSGYPVGTVVPASPASVLQGGVPARTSVFTTSHNPATTLGQGGQGGLCYNRWGLYPPTQTSGNGNLLATGGCGGMRGGFYQSGSAGLNKLIIMVDDIDNLLPI